MKRFKDHISSIVNLKKTFTTLLWNNQCHSEIQSIITTATFFFVVKLHILFDIQVEDQRKGLCWSSRTVKGQIIKIL